MASPKSSSGQATYGTALLILVALLLLAYALRLVNLDAFSFWTDEGLTPLRSGYSIAEILSNRITIQDGITRDTHPPLYYLIIHITRQMWGETDFAYRYPSLLAGVLLVPLLFQFGRHLQGALTGLFAALFTAVNPLQVYYGNEARMYAMYVLLAAAASYVLWRALSGVQVRRALPAYILLAGLALYTHYTAAFLIAVQSLFWIWLLWREGRKRLLGGLGIAALLLVLPIIPFTVPRIFTGVEANYFYVEPLVMLQDVWRFFTLGVTVDFAQPVVTLFLSAALLLAAIGFWAAGSWLQRLFLLSYLLAVVAGLMAGSLIKPMYQGVRHIMAGSPAFILLLAIGAADLWHREAQQEAGQRFWRRLAALALTFALLVGALYALSNLYADPSFAKDDFRSMIRYIERRAGESDVVLYHNAVLLPLHAHYRTRSDLDVTALPVYPHSAEDVEEQLIDLTQRYDRIWFTSDPPADKRDVLGRVPAWLRSNLQDVDNESFHARTTVVHSTGFRTAPALTESLPEAGQALAINWPGFPQLRGIEIGAQKPAGDSTLWLDLFWQGDAPSPSDDAIIRLWLEDRRGETWASYEQGIADNPANWPAAQLLRESYKLPLPEAMPPGTYALKAEPLNDQRRSLGEPQTLAQLELAPSPPLSGTPAVIFENGLILQRLDWFDESVHPGHNMSVALLWQTVREEGIDLQDLRYEVDVVAPDGEVVRTVRGQPGDGGLPALAPDTTMREVLALYFPPESATGQYELWWRLYERDQPVGGRPFWRPWPSAHVIAGDLQVSPWPLNTTLPAGVETVNAEFGPDIRLYGYEIEEATPDALPLTLHWLAAQQPRESYLVFVHLVEAASGAIVSQVDRVPVDDLRPTSGWRAGEVLRDHVELPLPPDLAPGAYRLNAGFYNPDNGERLPVILDGERLPEDQLSLATIRLP